MKLQENKTYRTRNGLIVSGLEKANNGTNYIFEAEIQEPEYSTPSFRAWKENGRFITDTYNHRLDIIEEIGD